MNNSKLVHLLRALSKEEFKDFEKFASTYFTSGRDVSELIKFLRKNHPEFKDEFIKKEKIFEILYPGKKYNDGIMRAQIASVTKAVEDFLIHSHLSEENVKREMILLKDFRKRNLYKFYESHFETLEKNIYKLDVETGERYQLLSELYEESLIYFVSINNAKAYHKYFYEYVNSCVCSWILKSFESARQDKILKKFYNYEPAPNIFAAYMNNLNVIDFLRHIKDSELTHYKKTIELYYVLFTAFVNDEQQNTQGFIEKPFELFNSIKSSMPYAEKKLIYRNIHDIYMQMYNSGISSAKHHIYELINEMLRDKIFNTAGGTDFELNLFRTILLGAFDKPDWVEKTVNEYSYLLNDEVRDVMVSFAFTFINIGRENPGKALEYLSKLDYITFISKSDVKILSLMVYYDLNYYEEALSTIDAFKHYMANSKEMSSIYRTMFGNFTNYILKLFKLRESFDKNEAEYLSHQIKTVKMIGYDSWLLKKIETLIKEKEV